MSIKGVKISREVIGATVTTLLLTILIACGGGNTGGGNADNDDSIFDCSSVQVQLTADKPTYTATFSGGDNQDFVASIIAPSASEKISRVIFAGPYVTSGVATNDLSAENGDFGKGYSYSLSSASPQQNVLWDGMKNSPESSVQIESNYVSGSSQIYLLITTGEAASTKSYFLILNYTNDPGLNGCEATISTSTGVPSNGPSGGGGGPSPSASGHH